MASPHVAGSVALCFGDGGVAGPCAGMTPSQVIQKLRSDAQARSSTPGYGFTGDPNSPVSSRYYGYLVSNSAPPPPTPDFTIAASPASRTVTVGAGTTYSVTVTALNGYSTGVNLSVTSPSPLPTGMTAGFAPGTVTPTGTATLNVSTSSSTPPGTYPLTITGESGSLAHATSVNVVVQPVSEGDFTISVSPTSRTVSRPFWGTRSTTYTITLRALSGYNSPVALSVSGLATGLSATFSPSSLTPTTGGVNSTMRITVTSSAQRTTRTLTITGVGSDGKTHTVTVTLGVN